jgi:AraC-like DNA-binding protein
VTALPHAVPPLPSRAPDEVLAALDDLVAAARANIVSWIGVMERAEEIRRQIHLGVPYGEMEVDSATPPIIDAVARNQERLTAVAARFRRALAGELAAEGWSAAEIAKAFGVSRQRVANLLKADGASAPATATPVAPPRRI